MVWFGEGCGKSRGGAGPTERAVDAAVHWALRFEKGPGKLTEEKFAQLLNTKVANLAQEG